MHYQITENGIVITDIVCAGIRFDSGVFFVHAEHGSVHNWQSAFTLKPGQFLEIVRGG
jgi:hypothetical protein